MWLVGVVVRWYIYIDILTIIINFPYSTCISSFLQPHPISTSSFIFKMFFALYKMLLKEHLRSFKNRDHANMAI